METSDIIFCFIVLFVLGYGIGKKIERIRIRKKYGDFYHDDFEGYGYTDIESELNDN